MLGGNDKMHCLNISLLQLVDLHKCATKKNEKECKYWCDAGTLYIHNGTVPVEHFVARTYAPYTCDCTTKWYADIREKSQVGRVVVGELYDVKCINTVQLECDQKLLDHLKDIDFGHANGFYSGVKITRLFTELHELARKNQEKLNPCVSLFKEAIQLGINHVVIDVVIVKS